MTFFYGLSNGFRLKPFLIRNIFYNVVSIFFRIIALIFGFPINTGMPIMPSEEIFFKLFPEDFTLKMRKAIWPPVVKPKTLSETIFGKIPKPNTIKKLFYINKNEGFYNFYAANHQNNCYLPNFLSKFIQLWLGICLNTSPLEIVREILFLALYIFSQMLAIRVAMAWFIVVNPFAVPWCYINWFIDWSVDLLAGVIPLPFAINITAPVLFSLIGATADVLNNLIFTMPFLPSEGEIGTAVGKKEDLKDAIFFHFLPVLWYQYPIPYHLREYWQNERPDILKYMLDTYGHLGIKFTLNTPEF